MWNHSQSALIFKVLASHKPKTGGTWWVSWLRHCATSWKVAGSIPAGVIGILHWHNPSGCTMALGSTQPLTEMSTRNISWGGSGWCIQLIILPLSCVGCLEINLLESSRSVQGLLFLLYKPKTIIYIHQHCTSIEKIWKSVICYQSIKLFTSHLSYVMEYINLANETASMVKRNVLQCAFFVTLTVSGEASAIADRI